ncbi:MAG: nucleoside 2-deoxyribosyltransferase [Neomegalonema sp.]|nr:nucleoside 2-deoxyribosyltransferase [Neomegalonema sp.]
MAEQRPKIYLAGPDVFHADAKSIGAQKKSICAQLGMDALWPLDNELCLDAEAAPHEIAARIYDANIAMLNAADGVIANATPFLGALADDGTSFEIGFAVARGLPLALYDNGVGDTATKASDFVTAAPELRDRAITAEDFELPVNLMLALPAARSCGIATGDAPLPLTDLSRFEEAAQKLAAHFAERAKS